jgi:DNA-binding NtrC family response regulator
MEGKLSDITKKLKGRRILLVEDSPVISDATGMMLEDMGCDLVGPAATMAPALVLAEEEKLDAAVVDINIRGGKAYNLLTVLARRNVPFLLTSGYADWSMPDEWRERPRLTKPYNEQELQRAVADLLEDAAPAA